MGPPPASNAVPPVLPPSVEEAYRRKCIQLRARTQTVAESNDAARIRLLRMRRGIEKMRLERAFLLEQVARRVKPNDDSSDGSPSPPPTPQQKPLRVKRGRRAPDFMAAEGLHTQASQDNNTDNGDDDNNNSRTHNAEDDGKDALERDRLHFEARIASGEPNISRIGRQLKPESGFDVFAETLFGPLSVDRRREIAAGVFDVRNDIARKWLAMGQEERAKWNRRFMEGDYDFPESNGKSGERSNVGGEDGPEDVEMANNDMDEDRD